MKITFLISTDLKYYFAKSLVFLSLFVISAAITPAVTLTVNKTADTSDGICDSDCSLREATIAASNGDSIQFSDLFDMPQTIHLVTFPFVLEIDKNLTIIGKGSDLLTITADNNGQQLIVIYAARSLTISNVTLTQGSTAIRNFGTLNISNSVITNNSGGIQGNGIDNEGGIVNIDRCTISNNSSPVGGGVGIGILNSSGEMIVTNTTISGNSSLAGGSGGGIQNYQGNLTVINSTISGNNALTGSAIHNAGTGQQTAQVKLVNSTITGNTGNFGAVFNAPNQFGTISVLNSIIAANGINSTDVTGSFDSQGNNLIGNNQNSNFVNGNNNDKVGTNSAHLSPNLGPLQNNGGSTLTHSLLLNSPASNSGNNCVFMESTNGGCLDFPLLFDQRGFSRLAGAAVDIGAVEMLIPTASSAIISGRVISKSNGLIPNAKLTISGGNLLNPITVRSSSFGYYAFPPLPVGNIYVISIAAKNYEFENQILNLTDNTTVNFIGLSLN